MLFLISIIALDFEHSYQYVQREVLILLGKGFVFLINSNRRKTLLRIFFKRSSSPHCKWSMVGSHGTVSVCAVLSVDAEEPVVLRVKCVCCAMGRAWVSGTACLH